MNFVYAMSPNYDVLNKISIALLYYAKIKLSFIKRSHLTWTLQSEYLLDTLASLIEVHFAFAESEAYEREDVRKYFYNFYAISAHYFIICSFS